MSLDEARALMADPHANRNVQYQPSEGKVEFGTIVSVGYQYVFVRYGDDWQAKATAPEQLTLVVET